MDRPVLMPPLASVGDPVDGVSQGTPPKGSPASPSKRRIRPGWKAVIVRTESFTPLREIQKSTADPVLDLSYLMDACVQLALQMGADAIVQRALADLRPVVRGPRPSR